MTALVRMEPDEARRALTAAAAVLDRFAEVAPNSAYADPETILDVAIVADIACDLAGRLQALPDRAGHTRLFDQEAAG